MRSLFGAAALTARASRRRLAAFAPQSTTSGVGTAPASPQQPAHLMLLEYVYAAATPDELAAKRAPMRGPHLALAARWAEQGRLLLGGATSDLPSGGVAASLGGVLVFRVPGADDAARRAEVERFVREDPYVLRGLVSSWRVRAWTVVVGALPV